jgi:hypothetical protein
MLIPLAFMLAAAEPATAAPSPRPSPSAPAVLFQPSLHVQKQGRNVTFTVIVHNAGSELKELQFSDAGLLQIVVTSPDGTQLYDSRAGRMFATVMKTVPVPSGKDATFTAIWDAPTNVTGPLRVRAVVRANPPLSACGPLDLP